MYYPAKREQITELRLLLEDAGKFCSYERNLPKGTAFESIRYKTGRKQDTSCIITAVVILRITQRKSETKIVDMEIESHTCKINGATGALVPPHLDAYGGPLKSAAFLRKVRTYARTMVAAAAPKHYLVQKGWHLLPPEVDQLPQPED